MAELLLPRNSTPQELAADDALGTRVDAVPVPLRDLWDPWRCPTAWLPWLAWALSVDIWDDDWDVARKRSVISRSIRLHELKGTLEGIRQHVALAGGKLTRAILPPSRALLGPVWTDEERAAWLSRYPELRVYRRRTRGEQIGIMLAGRGALVKNRTFLGAYEATDDPLPVWGEYLQRWFGLPAPLASWKLRSGVAIPVMSTAAQRILPRVYEVRGGVETELTTAVYQRGTRTVETVRIERSPAQRGRVITEAGEETVYQIVGPALRGAGAMLGDPSVSGAPVGSRLWLSVGGKRYLTDRRPHKRTYLTRFTTIIEMPETETVLARPNVQPLLDRQRTGIDVTLTEGDVITAQAEPFAERGTRQGAFYGRLWPGTIPGASRPSSFLVDHYPGARIYLSSRLYDPTVPTPPQSGQFFCGVTRLGMPAYHAELAVAVRRRRSARAFGTHVAGHLVASDPPFRSGALGALRAAVAARDKIQLDLKTTGPVVAGGEQIAGDDLIAGKWSDLR